MAQDIIQKLTIHLRGGQTVEVPFNAQQADKLNPQVDLFLKAMGEPEKKEKNFLFQGARVVIVRLADVSAAEVVSLIRKPKEEAAANA